LIRAALSALRLEHPQTGELIEQALAASASVQEVGMWTMEHRYLLARALDRRDGSEMAPEALSRAATLIAAGDEEVARASARSLERQADAWIGGIRAVAQAGLDTNLHR
jgi:hypothetical protein